MARYETYTLLDQSQTYDGKMAAQTGKYVKQLEM